MNRSWIVKVKSLWGELGPGGLLCYALYRVCALSGGWAAFHRYLFVAQPIPKEALLPPRRGQSIAVRLVALTDAVLFCLPLDEKVLSYRAQQGAICFGAFKGEDIVGCLWLCLGSYEEDEVRARYRPEPPAMSSWDFDVYLKPEHRNGLEFARLWDTANEFLRRRGITYSWSRISAFNSASLASHRRLGARVIGSANFLRMMRCEIMVAGVPPYFHCSLSKSSVPLIRLFHRGNTTSSLTPTHGVSRG